MLDASHLAMPTATMLHTCISRSSRLSEHLRSHVRRAVDLLAALNISNIARRTSAQELQEASLAESAVSDTLILSAARDHGTHAMAQIAPWR